MTNLAEKVRRSVRPRREPPTPLTAPWLYASPMRQYDAIQTPAGPVRYVPPRSEVPGRPGTYPPGPAGPRVPRRKRAPERQALAYYPRHHAPEHPRRWEFPAYLDNPACAWLGALKRLYADPLAFPSSLSPEAGLLVHALVRNLRPRVVIETGTFLGVSTIWMAAALKENGDAGVVHTFDYFGPIEKGPYRDAELKEDRIGRVAESIARAGLAEHAVLHRGNTAFEIRAAHAELRAAGGVQLAFLDADHGVWGVLQDFWATEEVLQTGGLVLLHDTFPDLCGGHAGGRHLLDTANRVGAGLYEKVDLYLSPMNYGMGLLRRVG
ncbi:MAG TPA: class I SAM-dependent methyltransferase [Phycisphaerales bacterium]|nr:class I SAM-dependent methyltransferase [Phycisphaerales bacterium]